MSHTNSGGTRGEINSPLLIEWKVDFISLLSETEFVSPKFQFFDEIWHLRCYPRGSSDGNPNYVSLSLEIENPVSTSRIIYFQFGIRNGDGTVYFTDIFDETVFSEEEFSCEKPKFLKRSSLRKDKLLIAPRGVVTFFCTLQTEAAAHGKSQALKLEGTSVSTQTSKEDMNADLLVDLEEESLTATSVSTQTSKEDVSADLLLGLEEESFTGPYKLAQDLKNLILKEQDCDITIKVNERDFKAHRSILEARSPVFSSMFSHDTIERKTGNITIEDCDPDVFHIFLMFLYSGDVEEFNSDNVCHLYAVAEKYDVEELKSKCIKYIVSCISVDNFCSVMCLAVKYTDLQLIKVATDFFVKNAKKIILTVDWQRFHKEYPQECNELFIKVLAHLAPE